jgi:hypothetical protein
VGLRASGRSAQSFIPEALFNCVHILPIGHGLVEELYFSSLTREKFLVVSDLERQKAFMKEFISQ